MIELTPADLPDAIASMSTGAGITEVEMREIERIHLDAEKLRHDQKFSDMLKTAHAHRGVLLAKLRAVEARTRQATPAPDAVAEALRRLAIKQHVRMAYGGGTVPSGGSCELCDAEWEEGEDESHAPDCLIATHTTQKTGEE